MTPQEIKAFARQVSNDREFFGKRVFIKRDDKPLYLSRYGQWIEKPSPEDARDYTVEKIGGQLFQVEIQHGALWSCESL